MVFCFIRMSTFGSTRLLRGLCLSFLVSCVVRSPTNGMVSHIVVESWLVWEVIYALCKSDVVYEFTCPGCHCSYIGKTNRTLFTRTQEHALTDKESAIYKHLRQCDNIQHIQGLYNFPDIFSNKTGPPSTTTKESFTETVRSNTKIIDSDDNWNLLLYKEAYHIKRSSPSLNNGLKASRELCLFS